MKYIVIYGKDMNCYGPFDSFEQADAWAREYFGRNYEIKPLHRPA